MIVKLCNCKDFDCGYDDSFFLRLRWSIINEERWFSVPALFSSLFYDWSIDSPFMYATLRSSAGHLKTVLLGTGQSVGDIFVRLKQPPHEAL